MLLFDAIASRRSVRSFLSDAPVPQPLLERLLLAATWAPSAGNAQSWRFTAVRDPATRRRLASAALGQLFVAQAPVVVVACADLERAGAAYGQRGQVLYCLQDTAAAVQNLLLAAAAEGLGSCWVGAFDERAVSRVLGLGSGLRPTALVPLGYTNENPPAPPRRPLDEVVEYR